MRTLPLTGMKPTKLARLETGLEVAVLVLGPVLIALALWALPEWLLVAIYAVLLAAGYAIAGFVACHGQSPHH